MMTQNKTTASGFSLVELMISMVIGLLVILAIGTMFVSSSRNYTQDDRMARLQENGRFAMYVLAQDLSMAAFWGGLTMAPSGVTSLGSPCGIALNLLAPLKITNSPTGTAANSAHDCINATTFVAGTDVIAVKRVFGAKETTHTNNAAYLRVDGSSATLLQYTGTGPSTGQEDWRYIPRIYYVRNKTVDAVNVPTLYRKVLSTSLTMVDEELVEGIENIQIQFGIDTDVPADGKANFYTASPTSNQLVTAVTARINVLARSTLPDPDPSYRNGKTYDLGEGVIAATNDRYRRQLFTTTVPLRNVKNLSLL